MAVAEASLRISILSMSLILIPPRLLMPLAKEPETLVPFNNPASFRRVASTGLMISADVFR
ncbi:hypothetical protein D3C87_2025320 [compost metagenome]